jgi:hypothetical protein
MKKCSMLVCTGSILFSKGTSKHIGNDRFIRDEEFLDSVGRGLCCTDLVGTLLSSTEVSLIHSGQPARGHKPHQFHLPS